MNLLLIGLLLWTAITALLALSINGVRRLLGARPRWRRVLWFILATLPLHTFVTVPATLGYLGAHMVHTRRDEAAYRGPLLTSDGAWTTQTRATLKQLDAALTLPTKPAECVALTAADGVALRAFYVPAGAARRPIDAVLVHGLFRGGLELETVGRWLRDLGCDVLLLELRNHGGSARVPASFGPREALDVRAAAAWFDRREGAAQRRLALFGVSLGSVATALAAPDIDRLHWLVLDAPVIDPAATAQRMLAGGPRRAQGRLGFPEPFCSLSLTFLQWWAGVDLAAIRPLDALRQLPPTVRALVIGGGSDDRVSVADVEAAWAAIPVADHAKDLWIAPDAEHGTVWDKAPAEYQRRLQRLMQE